MYSIKVKSLVPTNESWYEYVNWNLWDINLKDFIVKEESISNSNYDTTSSNSNYISRDSSLNNSNTQKLNFDAPLHIDLQASSTFKDWNNALRVKLTNKSKESTFILKKFRLLFTYENGTSFSPDINISGTSITSSAWNTINNKWRSFDITLNSSLSISAWWSNYIDLTVNANLYRQDLWSIWYISYIPQNWNNQIWIYTTSYNTSTFWLGYISYNDVNGSPLSYTSTWSSVDISEISIAWSTATVWKDWAIKNATWGNSSIFIDNWWIDKAKVKRDIKKSVETFTKWINPEKYLWSSIDESKINSNKILYYDFSDTDCTIINWNKWCVLTLPTGMLKIDWVHTIIVRWWSIHLKSDMYYANKNSLLWIIVLKYNKKWWNVYIDPSVTNIVWSIYSDWSVMSYDWNTTDVSSLEPILGKQLHIYWNLFTANTVWWSYGNIPSGWECPYGSDYYDNNNNWNCIVEWEAQKYDLARLRNMTLVNNGSWTWAMVYGTTTNEIIHNWLSWGVTYIGNNTTTDLINPTNNSAIIVEYNPQIKFLDLPWFIIK